MADIDFFLVFFYKKKELRENDFVLSAGLKQWSEPGLFFLQLEEMDVIAHLFLN